MPLSHITPFQKKVIQLILNLNSDAEPGDKYNTTADNLLRKLGMEISDDSKELLKDTLHDLVKTGFSYEANSTQIISSVLPYFEFNDDGRVTLEIGIPPSLAKSIFG